MKYKRLQKWLSLAIMTTMFGLFFSTGVSSGTDFDKIRLRFEEFLAGGDIDTTDPDVAGLLAEFDKDAQGYWKSMNKAPYKCIWPDLIMNKAGNVNRQGYHCKWCRRG